MSFSDFVVEVLEHPLDSSDADGSGGHGLADEVRDLIVRAPEFFLKNEDRGPTEWIYVSGLAGGCARMIWMERVGLAKPSPLVSGIDAEWRMRRGTAYHEMIQSLWLGPTGKILGGWVCSKCGNMSGFGHSFTSNSGCLVPAPPEISTAVKRPAECVECGATYGEFGYVEISVSSKAGGPKVRGRIDMLLDLGGRRVIGDLKITDKSVRTMKYPYNSHIDAMILYLGFAEIDDGVVVYVDPSSVRKAEKDLANRIAVFPVRFDQHRFDALMELARAIEETPKTESGGVPCPHGGVLPWGPCDCVAASGARIRPWT